MAQSLTHGNAPSLIQIAIKVQKIGLTSVYLLR